jgi:hypothetical protein
MSGIIDTNLSNIQDKKAHPWRICPIGKHYVKEHLIHTVPSKSHPDGMTVTCHEHCASNQSSKDELSHYEIQYIDNTYFSNLQATWEEAIIEYKGYWDEVEAGEDPEGIQLLRQFYKILQGN